ncbi:MAG: hypothetical protein AAB496_01495 [Patescibacteria group bacterium]
MKSILVTCYVNPDLDGVAGVVAERLNLIMRKQIVPLLKEELE